MFESAARQDAEIAALGASLKSVAETVRKKKGGPFGPPFPTA